MNPSQLPSFLDDRSLSWLPTLLQPEITVSRLCTASCYRSSLLSLLSPCSLIPSTLLADIQIDRPLVFSNLASRQFHALHAVSHSFRSPYHSHSAPLITSLSAPRDPACPVPSFCDYHRHCTHTRNSFSAFPFISAVPYSFLCIDCCIPYRFYFFFVSISVQTNSDHSRTCNGQAIAVSRPTPCQSFCIPTPPHALYTFSAIASVIVRIHAR